MPYIWNLTTTRNAQGKLPKVNDKIMVDGIPADVIKVDPFHGIQYQIAIPGLRDADGNQVFIKDWAPWSIVLDLQKVEMDPAGGVVNL